MNRITKGLSLLLALLCLLAAASSACAEEGGIVRGVALVKIGECEAGSAPEGDGRSLWEKLMYTDTPRAEYLEDGYYSVAGGGEDVNQRGLFAEDGELLLPFEAALFKRMNARYLMVYTATEQTEDWKEALLYESDGFWLGQGYPKDGDIMYKGYARFYDLENRRFVGDLIASESNVTSGRLLVLRGKGVQEAGIYDENGDKVYDRPMTAGHGFLILPQKEVYDEDLNLRYTSETQLEQFSSGSGYLLEYLADGGKQVIDIDGRPVVPGPLKSVFDEQDGFISAQLDDGSYVLISVQRGLLARSDERFFRRAAGYYYGQDKNGYLFVGPDGIIADHLENRPESSLQVWRKDSDGQNRTLALNTGEWTLPLGRALSMGSGLADQSTLQKDGEHHIFYDLFTGEVLLEGDYDSVKSFGRLILTQRGAVRELYRIQYRYE